LVALRDNLKHSRVHTIYDKLEPAWLGPYTIHRYIGKGLYELSKDAKVVKKKANIARLKIYRKRTRGNDEEKDGPPTKKVY